MIEMFCGCSRGDATASSTVTRWLEHCQLQRYFTLQGTLSVGKQSETSHHHPSRSSGLRLYCAYHPSLLRRYRLLHDAPSCYGRPTSSIPCSSTFSMSVNSLMYSNSSLDDIGCFIHRVKEPEIIKTLVYFPHLAGSKFNSQIRITVKPLRVKTEHLRVYKKIHICLQMASLFLWFYLWEQIKPQIGCPQIGHWIVHSGQTGEDCDKRANRYGTTF